MSKQVFNVGKIYEVDVDEAIESVVKIQGNSAKVNLPKKFLGRKAIVLIIK